MNTATNSNPPRIWVGCLASYNGGTLHGEWFDLDDYADADDLSTAVSEKVLATSPEPGAEEFHICDHENFGPFSVDRYESLTDVHRKAELLDHVDEDLLAAACDGFGEDYVRKALLDDEDWVNDRHVGTHENKGDYAYDDRSEDCPEHLKSYVKWDCVEDDMCSDGLTRVFHALRYYYFHDC